MNLSGFHQKIFHWNIVDIIKVKVAILINSSILISLDWFANHIINSICCDANQPKNLDGLPSDVNFSLVQSNQMRQ